MLIPQSAVVDHIEIPFRFAFEHALASRQVGDGVLLRLTDAQGLTGYGETAARGYVSGEDWPSVSAALRAWLPAWLGRRFESFAAVVAALEGARRDLPRNRHAAFCALELALLDLAGRHFECSAGTVIGAACHAQVEYTAVVSAGGGRAQAIALRAAKELGVRAIKVKVGGDDAEDLRLLQQIRDEFGTEISLRIDANCAWDAVTALDRLRRFESLHLDAVEQPCAADDLDGLAAVTASAGVPVIVDESLVSMEDADRLIARRACHVFNIRIAKCGGLLAARKLRERAADAGLRYMLGAQVGETSILAAAGRLFACRSTELMFCEGSYGDLLLAADVAQCRVGPGGVGPALQGDGLGLDVEHAAIAEYVTESFAVD